MRRSILPVLIIALVVVVISTDAMAMYNPRLGRFMQRDPYGTAVATNTNRMTVNAIPNSSDYLERDSLDPILQYEDGLSLYQYQKSNPVIYLDPAGLAVHLRPLNGKVNNRSSYDVTVNGDYVEARTYIYGSFSGSEYPKTEARRAWLKTWSVWALGGSVTFINHGPVSFTVPSGSNSTTMRDSGATLVVDVDFVTGSSVAVYDSRLCVNKATMPYKVGAGTVTVNDCPTVTDPNNNSCKGVYLAGW